MYKNLYFLSYDLRRDRDYQRLYNALAEFHAVRILESCWCFYSNASASNLRDYFMKLIDSDDGIVVTQVVDWASCRTLNVPLNIA